MATKANSTASDSSTMRTPATLSSGDLVSRLVAATPPYLYNVQLTPHSFFFSEMLRSYVQPKPETTTSAVSIGNAQNSATSSTSVVKRRKRPWRDTRDRPLELTTKDKTPNNHDSHNLSHHHHHPHHPLSQQEAYFHQELIENKLKTIQTLDGTTRNLQSVNFDQKSNGFANDVMKQIDENNPDFVKNSRHFFDDSSRFFTHEHLTNPNTCAKTFDEKSKMEHELNLAMEHRNKMDFSERNFISGSITGMRSDDMKHNAVKTCGFTAISNNNNITNNNNSNSNNNNSLSANTELIPSPLWYPPYPMTQSYPGIDPLHFFIDLRVSGHIWDRKLNERQLPFKGKHCSAFNVPQAKEFNNRPLNLTRDEATTSRGNDQNYYGTHFILKNLTKTYKDIEKISKMATKNETDENVKDTESVEESSKGGVQNASPCSQDCHDEENTNGKDLRALIGLELVVDYVKEPKEEPNSRASPKISN